METLTQTFADATANYPALKRICEERVVRWEWGTFVLYEPQPFYHERHKIVRGRKLSGQPSEIKDGMNEYGFDAQNEVVVVRQYLATFPGRFYETFFVAADNKTDGAHFSHRPTKDVINVSRQTFANGRIVRFERVARGGTFSEVYQYDGDRLVSIKSVATMNVPKKEVRHTDEISYDENGRLNFIRRLHEIPAQPDSLLYQRPQEGESVEELAKIIAANLIRQIPQTLRAARIAGPVYCVILYYTSEDAPRLPPVLFVGLEKQRQDWATLPGNAAKGYVWNVSEFDRSYEDVLSLKGSELLAACNIFNQELAINGDWERARNILNEVAKTLNLMEWSDIFDVTDDFIVFAVDTEEVDFDFNLEASVSAERLAMLKARKWI